MTDITPTPAPGFGDAVAVRQNAVTARAEAERATRALRAQQEAAKADLEQKKAELEAEFRRRTAELEEQMRPLAEHLARLRETLWTADLYLGRDEDIHVLRDGAPAPDDTPIAIRQKVLSMAEESLVLIGKRNARGMEAEDIQEFIDWLTATPENLDRVLPEPKGVVVLVPTRVSSNAENMYERASRDAANERAYWLIRNGERLYLLTTDPELEVRDRILPLRTEFTDVFDRGLFGFRRGPGEHVKPGSAEWMELEKAADAKRRHYMRLMLVLQGILDRTTALHPLPGGTVNLMDVRAQDNGQVILIQDDENSLQLTDGHESFAAWQERLNAQMRPGMRIVANFTSEGFLGHRPHDAHGRITPWENTRLSPTKASTPQSGDPYLLEGRRGDGFFFRYERTDEIWKRDVPVPDRPGYVYRTEMPVAPSRRASCMVKASDDWVIPFDLATVDDLRYFLNSRTERSKHFLSLVPVVQAALDAKEAESAQEGPFRSLLGDMLAHEGVDQEQVPATLDDLVHWWKTRNLYARPLNGDPKHEARAAAEIMAEYRARQAASTDPDLDRVLAAGRRVPGAIAVARDRKGRWAAYSPTPGTHDEGVYLDITPIRRNGTHGAVKTDQTLTWRAASDLHVVWSTDAWDTWSTGVNPNHYLTRAERASLVDQMLDGAEGRPMAVVELAPRHALENRVLAVYSWTGPEMPEQMDATADESTFVRLAWFRVVKDKDGTRLAEGTDYRPPMGVRADFGGYSSTEYGLSDLPWWPDTARRFRDDRPRRVWVDEDILTSLAAHRAAVKAERDRVREAQRARQERLNRRVNDTMEALESEWTARVRTRFLEDYGEGAEDLWEGHLKVVKRPASFPTRDAIYRILSAVQEVPEAQDGGTLAAMVALAPTERWYIGDRKKALVFADEWGHVLVPADGSGDDEEG